MFTSVSKESKAYKLFNPLMKKIVISRDVIFDFKKNLGLEYVADYSNCIC